MAKIIGWKIGASEPAFNSWYGKGGSLLRIWKFKRLDKKNRAIGGNYYEAWIDDFKPRPRTRLIKRNRVKAIVKKAALKYMILHPKR